MTWLLVLAAYLIGATPTSYLVGRMVRGIDLREHGSGNLGATNAFRVLGWRAAVPVMLVDVAKGWAPTVLFPQWDGVPVAEWALAYGAAAILGHVFSLYVGFRGGKGVATSAGVFLALAPWAVLIGFIVWGVTVTLTRIVSLASLLAAVVLPVAVFVTNEPPIELGLAVGLSAFVIYAHRTNIQRLLRGEESRFGSREKEAG
ncbi:MAG TPA: glycerol-3-phosphate 1-O-acyltransferase PlsY [Longimicrobiales bacterium]|nr:glycerol-3-phosphate 1-O-acyltransferase PlsY [Longimicrobiales bacterium]